MQLETLSYDSSHGWNGAGSKSLDSDNTLVCVFGAPEYRDRPEILAELAASYPRSQIIGCSTSGEIFGDRMLDGTISVGVARFEHTTLRSTSAVVADIHDSFEAGATLARALDDPRLRGVFVLSDGLKINGSELVRGLNSVLPGDVVVTGGLAGDGDRFESTWVIVDGKPTSGYVTAVGFYGDRLRIGHGSKGGWDYFGPERRVTRSEGSVVYELDGKPALELYKRYLGDRASGLPATALLFPLNLRCEADDEKGLVRTVLAIDEETQSMTFAGDVPEGSVVSLMRANFDRLIEGAHQAASVTNQRSRSNGPTLVIAVSCVGRRLVLGERIEEELEATLEALSLSSGSDQIGFYSYGEISPYANGSCDLHNQTMTLTTLAEG